MFIQAKSPKITSVLCFTILYLSGFIAFSAIRQEYEDFIYIGFQLVLSAIFLIAHRLEGYRRTLLWCLSIWGLLHLTGELVPISTDASVINSLSLLGVSFNQLVHVYGFAVLTWVSWQTLCLIIHSRYQRRLMPTTGLLLLCATSSIGYGALIEMLEYFSATSLNLGKLQGTLNTKSDMIVNTLGAIITSVIIKLRSL